MSSSLAVSDLSAYYPGSIDNTEVFRSVSFDVEPGHILGVFGPNGCGKTTLLKVLAGLKAASAGSVSLPAGPDGASTVTVIPQDYRATFFEWASLKQNLALTSATLLSNPRQVFTDIDTVREELGLDLNLSLRPRSCSGGMLQQAAMLRVFQNLPAVILADEPFSALDVNVAATVRANFRRLVKAQGIVSIVVLHQLQDLVAVCDSVLVISGRPFSTIPGVGLKRAVVLNNEMLSGGTLDRDDLDFVALARRVISKPEGWQ